MRNLAHIAAVVLLVLLFSPLEGQTPFGYRFVRTLQNPANVLYDRVHDHFFVTVPDTNELLTVSAADGSVLSRTAIISPGKLDLSADSTRLYVMGQPPTLARAAAEGFFIVDAASSQILDFVAPTIVSSPLYSVPTSLAVMKNGKVFYTATEVLSFGLYSYDPLTELSTHITVPDMTADIVGLTKSADGTRLVFFSDSHLWVYDSDRDAYVADRQITPELPSIRDVAVNSDASKILVDGHLLFDKTLTPVGDLTPGNGYNTVYYFRGAAFSPDGSKLYSASNYVMPGAAVGDFGTPAIAVYDTGTAGIRGYIPITSYFRAGLAIGNEGTAVLLCDQGFATLDVRGPLPNLARPLTSNGDTLGVDPSAGALSNPGKVTVFYGGGTGDPATVYFGSQPGTGLSTPLQPPFSASGLRSKVIDL